MEILARVRLRILVLVVRNTQWSVQQCTACDEAAISTMAGTTQGYMFQINITRSTCTGPNYKMGVVSLLGISTPMSRLLYRTQPTFRETCPSEHIHERAIQTRSNDCAACAQLTCQARRGHKASQGPVTGDPRTCCGPVPGDGSRSQKPLVSVHISVTLM